MRRDARGLAVTGADDRTIEAIDTFSRDLLEAREGASVVVDAATREPGCPLALGYAAARHFYAQSTEQVQREARPLLDRALAQRERVTERERRLLDALDAWARADHEAALASFEAIAARWPADLVAAKLAELLFFEVPDRPRQLALMETIAPAHRDDSSFLAMHAFALELVGQAERAERLARRALELDAHTPWAHHALAHVFLRHGRVTDGRRELGSYVPLWDAHSGSMRAHNAWHLALLHLADLDVEAALALLPVIWNPSTCGVVGQEDAIGLLWRAELAGAEVGSAWGPLAGQVRGRAREQVFPYLSAHCVYALARAGEEGAADEAMARVEEHAGRQRGKARHVWAEVGVPLVRASAAFARGAYAEAAERCAPVMADAECVGGSDAQNDVFAQMYLVALVRSGQRAAARTVLQARLGARPPTRLERSWGEG